MLRIVAGEFGGRKLHTPRGQRTHPMGDRIRMGLFNALGDVEGLTVLDAFGGSGALGLEALSRGAKSALLIEIDSKAQSAIVENLASLGVETKARLIKANCSIWSDGNQDKRFDLVLAAPPYDNLQEKVLQKLVRHIKPKGLYVLDWPSDKDLLEFDGLNLIKKLQFGDASLGFYRKSQ